MQRSQLPIRLLVGFATVFALVAGACGNDDDSAADEGTTPTEDEADGGDGNEFDGDITIGFIAERTGTFQAIGIPNYNSSRMAIEKLNDAGGVEIDGNRYRFVLEVRDSGTEEERASAAAIELTEEVGVNFMFGAIGPLGPLVLDVTEQNDVLYFASGTSTAERLPETEHLFITVPKFEDRLSLAMEGIRHFLPDSRTLGTLMAQDATAEAIRSNIEESAAEHDFEIVAEELVPAETTDFVNSLTNIRSSEPDVLWAATTGSPQAAAILQANEEVNAAPNVFSWATSCQNAVDADADRPVVTYALAPANVENPDSPAEEQFVEDYEEFTGESDPENLYTALWNYDFYFLLKEAIEDAGTFEDVESVRASLLEVEYEGVGGPVSFGPDRQAVTGASLCMYPGSGGAEAIETVQIEPGG